jgi:hypothetical protein
MHTIAGRCTGLAGTSLLPYVTLHHSAPSNPQHITMTFGLWTAIFITNVLLFAVPDQLLHLRILTGVAAAFLTYIVVGTEVHLRTHDGRWVPGGRIICRTMLGNKRTSAFSRLYSTGCLGPKTCSFGTNSVPGDLRAKHLLGSP